MTFPIIDEIPFSNVLIIDNKPKEVHDLVKDLKRRKISVVYAKKYVEAEAIVKQRPELSLIILDWRLDDQTSAEARQLVGLIRQNCFAPIIIYTDQDIQEPTEYLSASGLSRIAKAYNKEEVQCQQVFDEIKNWFTLNPELKIFLRWAHEVENKLNETLWAVHDLDVGGTHALVELLKSEDETLYVSAEQDLLNLFGKVLGRKLSNDARLLEVVKREIEVLARTNNVVATPEKLQKVQSFERYNVPNGKTLWTGSILRSRKGKFFVVVTPICDFYQQDNIEKIVLVEAEPLATYKQNREVSEGDMKTFIRNSKSCVHYLAYTPTVPEGLLCRFDRIINNDPKYLRSKLKNGEMTCIAIIDSPFVENLIQRMNAYLMRLGVRELDKREVTRLSRIT